MKTVEVTVLSDAVNNWVIQTPGRKYPGLVIQGDGLRQLQYLAHEVARFARELKHAELQEVASELSELLTGRLRYYEKVLDSVGFKAQD